MKWKKKHSSCGVITGCDANVEWLLPTWWKHYTKWNSSPVTFIDFGMTKSAKKWCSTKGDIITYQLGSLTLKSREEVCPLKAKFWERIYPGNVWQSRQSWFAKPNALLETPYETTIWVDLDTEIKKDLSPLFAYAASGFAIASAASRYQKFSRIVGLHPPKENIYNSGVFVFKHGCTVLKKWAEKAAEKNGEFLGDEQVLSHLLHQEKLPMVELPQTYNWPYFEPPPPDVAVIHFLGGGGKQKQLERL